MLMAGQDPRKKKDPKGGSDAQARFDKQAAFAAAGGKTPWNGGGGQWKKDGKVVDDPAGPYRGR